MLLDRVPIIYVVSPCLQVNKSKDSWVLLAKLSGRYFSGPDMLNAVAGQVTEYPLKFLPLREGVVEVPAEHVVH